MMVVSVLAGQVITKTGRYKIFPIIGGVGMVAGMVLLSMIDVHTTKLELALYMIVLGVGMGSLMQTTMLIAQNSVEQRDLGVASSSATFFRSIGGSFGVSLFGTIFVRTLHDDIAAQRGPEVADQITSGGGQVDPSMLQSMPAPIKSALFEGIAGGLSTVFLWAIPFAVAVALLAIFIKEVPLRGSVDTPEDATARPMAPALD